MTYRDMEIESLPYGGYGWSYSGDERYRGTTTTIEEAKQEIDIYIAENTQYRVVTQKTITKFWFLSDAMNFMKRVGGELVMIIDGCETEFDSI